ncbi:aminoacyl-tRNA hydrolase [Patescibacteria group bacterium]|nr:aminoacyl-tRNA hydrolase [Patescibacteria group bacterium]MBU1895900.1 aminoacyl-tRNA hydrolase [Patescibacteria group bacterium]
MKLIVGLGNPGKTYQKTRHNIGFMVLDALHKNIVQGYDWKLSKKFNAEIVETSIGDEKIILVKPMTFMNQSGEAVQLVMSYYKIYEKDLLVVHDDKDLPLGKIKIENDRGSAGHNGIKSIIEHIKTQDFTRVRIGVASENKKKMSDTSKFVLGKFGLSEKKTLKATIENSIQQILGLFKENK